MSYLSVIQAKFNSEPEDWSRFIESFRRFGIDSTVQSENPYTLTGYLHESDAGPEKIQSLTDDLLHTGASNVSCDRIVEEDWSENWKQFFKPKKIGKKFWICPSWEEIEPAQDEILINLDPGQAFGTGDHPTTSMCLELLEEIEVKNKKIADVGCGSGILSIACCLAGAEKVVAVDCDKVSIEVAQENARRNNVQFDTFQGMGFEPIDGQYDIVISNIISEAIKCLAPNVPKHISKGSHWIVSGIIKEHWDEVKDVCQSYGFNLIKEKAEGEWIAAIFRY